MRIRKNAKTSAFLHTNSNLIFHNHEPTLCLLNQSPWDIITFPSAHSSIHLQFDDFVTRYNVNLTANWSSADSETAIQSADSTKNSFECEYGIVNENRNENGEGKITNYELYQKEDKLGFMREDDVNDLQNDAVWATNKKAQPVSKSRGTKKRAVGITSKQNEFYYYSGFGPSWGKKRGEFGEKCTTFNACGTIVTTNSMSSMYETSDDGNMDVEEDKKGLVPDTTTMKTVWSCEVPPEKEDFDCMEEDEPDDVKQKEKTVKKRGRKPIKARSLKSLM
ncbi:hypothetical protein R6Q57_015502 [Mikania cordata]